MMFVDAKQVSALLKYRDCIDAMKEAMARLSSGETEQMLRQILPLDRSRMFGVMAGAMGENSAWGSKLVSVTPERSDPTIPSHQGVVVLFEPKRGAPAAVVEAGELTAIRTASASAMATDILALPEASSLAILGTGEQAYHHALAMREVRNLTDVRIWGRSIDKAEALAHRLKSETVLDATAYHRVDLAVTDADIICTVTASYDPILPTRSVKPGAHINLVGSSFDGPREIDDSLVAASRFFADSVDSVRAQGAEFRHALSMGVIEDSHLLGEIGEVILGWVPGRTSTQDITIYNSLGHIVQDIASAALVVELVDGLRN